MRRLTPWRLLLSNLARRRFRSLALVAVSASLVGGVALLACLLRGLGQAVTVGTQRFGADLVVVPRGAKAAAQEALIAGAPTQLAMPAANYEKIRALPGIAQASPQLYLKTLANARCCPGEFFLIGFDPATDFTLAPWLATRTRPLGDHDALLGDRLSLKPGTDLPFFGTTFHAAGQLAPTGVGLDFTVFVPLAGARDMILHSRERAKEPLDLRPDQISVVLVKLDGRRPASAVAEDIAAGVTGVDVILAPQVIGAATRDLSGALRLLLVAAGALWLVLVPLLAVTFSLAVAQQRREIGLLRALGATSSFVFGLVLAEAGVTLGLGAVLGLAGAALVLGLCAGPLAASLSAPFVWPGSGYLAGLSAVLLVAALLTGGLSALVPARAAARAEAYECLRRAGG